MRNVTWGQVLCFWEPVMLKGTLQCLQSLAHVPCLMSPASSPVCWVTFRKSHNHRYVRFMCRTSCFHTCVLCLQHLGQPRAQGGIVGVRWILVKLTNTPISRGSGGRLCLDHMAVEQKTEKGQAYCWLKEERNDFSSFIQKWKFRLKCERSLSDCACSTKSLKQHITASFGSFKELCLLYYI